MFFVLFFLGNFSKKKKGGKGGEKKINKVMSQNEHDIENVLPLLLKKIFKKRQKKHFFFLLFPPNHTHFNFIEWGFFPVSLSFLVKMGSMHFIPPKTPISNLE